VAVLIQKYLLINAGPTVALPSTETRATNRELSLDDDPNRLRIFIDGTWHDLKDRESEMLKPLFQAGVAG
jgi:hypothetical protein